MATIKKKSKPAKDKAEKKDKRAPVKPRKKADRKKKSPRQKTPPPSLKRDPVDTIRFKDRIKIADIPRLFDYPVTIGYDPNGNPGPYSVSRLGDLDARKIPPADRFFSIKLEFSKVGGFPYDPLHNWMSQSIGIDNPFFPLSPADWYDYDLLAEIIDKYPLYQYVLQAAYRYFNIPVKRLGLSFLDGYNQVDPSAVTSYIDRSTDYSIRFGSPDHRPIVLDHIWDDYDIPASHLVENPISSNSVHYNVILTKYDLINLDQYSTSLMTVSGELQSYYVRPKNPETYPGFYTHVNSVEWDNIPSKVTVPTEDTPGYFIYDKSYLDLGPINSWQEVESLVQATYKFPFTDRLANPSNSDSWKKTNEIIPIPVLRYGGPILTTNSVNRVSQYTVFGLLALEPNHYTASPQATIMLQVYNTVIEDWIVVDSQVIPVSPNGALVTLKTCIMPGTRTRLYIEPSAKSSNLFEWRPVEAIKVRSLVPSSSSHRLEFSELTQTYDGGGWAHHVSNMFTGIVVA